MSFADSEFEMASKERWLKPNHGCPKKNTLLKEIVIRTQLNDTIRYIKFNNNTDESEMKNIIYSEMRTVMHKLKSIKIKKIEMN